MTLPSDFLLNLATELAADLVKAGADRLRALAFGDAETQALTRAWETAIRTMLEAVAAGLEEEQIALVDDLFREFIRAEGVADALLDLALEGREPPLEDLRARFDALGFDRAALSVDFDTALTALTRGLADALLAKAMTPQSPLYNWVSLGRVLVIHTLLQRQQETLASIASTIARLEERGGRTVYNIVIQQATGVAIGGGATVTELDPDLHEILPQVPVLVTRYVDHTSRGPYRLGVPFQAPAVPRHFVPRPKVSNDLRRLLLVDATATPGALVVSAIHGLGGIGKTTLIAALAHEPDLQDGFPDGVLWATLGQQPDVLSLLAGWIQALGDYNFRPTIVESASAHLRTLLHDKACLLVVDDAWEANHARPFLVGGPRCRVLLTTRDATLARKVGARLYDLDVMTEAQALALFEARLGPLGSDREQVAALARELGYLPLALELAAAQVEGGVSWTELLNAFRRALADLAVLELDEATYRNESLRLSFSLSLDGLPPDGRGGLPPDDREAFAWLGVLPEEVRLNPLMAAALWDQSEADAQRRLRRFRDKALLKPVGNNRYIIHDLLHHEAKLRLVEQLPLPEAHAVLLDRYRRKIPGGRWDRLPDDGYIHQRLAWHMEQAGQAEELHALLRLETGEGQNAWYQVREALGQTAGYLADVERAWRLADNEYALRATPFSVGLQCRYAAIIASLNSLAENMPPALLIALVKEKVWTPEQGLTWARRISEPSRRARSLTDLAPQLPEPLRGQVLREALTAAQVIGWQVRQAQSLVVLAPRLAELGYCRKALEVASELKEEWAQAEALNRVVSYLPEPLLRKALAMIQSFDWEARRARVLSRLASRLAELGYFQKALAIAYSIPGRGNRAEALVGLAPHLPEPLRGKAMQEALAEARGVVHELIRAKTLARLAPYLPEMLLRDALAAARAIKWETAQAKALVGLVPRLAELGYSEEALEAAQVIQEKCDRIEVLTKLIPFLPETERAKVLQEALLATRATVWESTRARALIGLAPYLAGSLLEEAVAIARGMLDKFEQARALIGLAPYLQEASLREILVTVEAIAERHDRSRAQAWLIPHLPEPLLREILARAQVIRDEDRRARTLLGLTPYLPEVLLREVTRAAQAVRDRRDLTKTLTELASRLAYLNHSEEALAAARAIPGERDRAGVLTMLIPHLSEVERPEAIREALAVAQTTMQRLALVDVSAESVSYLPEVLTSLAPHLPEALLRETLVAAQAIRDEDVRARALAGLIPHLPAAVLSGALAAAQKLESPWRRDEVLAEVAPRLAELGYFKEALATGREIESRNTRLRSLLRLVSHLPESQRGQVLQEALATAQMIKEDIAQATELSRLALQLAEVGYFHEALVAARAIRRQHDMVKTLIEMVPQLPGPEQEQALRSALATAQEIESEDDRANALIELVPHLPEPEQERALLEALAAARAIERSTTRVRTLSRLAPHLSGTEHVETMQEALAAARSIRDENERVRTLLEIAAHLPEAERAEVLQQVLIIAQAMRNKSEQVGALIEIASYLPDTERADVLRQALAAARTIPDESNRARAFVRLASHLPEPLLREALEAVQEIRGERERAEALIGLVPHLQESQQAQAVQAAMTAVQATRDSRDWGDALAGLVPYLSEMQLREVLKVAEATQGKKQWAKVLTELVFQLPEPLLREVLGAAQAVEDEEQRVAVLVRLTARPAELPPITLFPFWQETLHILAGRTRQRLLTDFQRLAPVIAKLGKTEAIAETFRAIQDTGRWWP